MATRAEILRFKIGDTIKNYRMLAKPGATPIDGYAEPLGSGGSGVVFLAEQILHKDITIRRAIKFFRFRDDIVEADFGGNTPVSEDTFLNEVINISSFSHENLTKVTDAGVHLLSDEKLLYLVTEYVPGPTLQNVCDESTEEAKGIAEIFKRNPTALLEVLVQLSEALRHLHEQRFCHCDIAPKNVFLSHRDGRLTAILGDLGVGRSLGTPESSVFLAGTADYMPESVVTHRYKQVEWNVFAGLQPYWDLFGLSKTGTTCMESLRPPRLPSWWQPLSIAFGRCQKKSAYQTAGALCERLRWLLPIHRELASVPELSSSLSGRQRKLMPVAALVTSLRVRKLIQHPALIRLTRVPQLLTSPHLFPSGSHSRYEHSLGVLETLRQYLIALLDQEEFLEHLDAETIETALVFALLSNVTRYPLYHIVDELRGFAPSRFKTFTKQHILTDALGIHDNKGRSLRTLIQEHFPRVPEKRLVDLLTDAKNLEESNQLLHSMLNCSLDARVVDFLRRDSHHLGLADNGFHLDDLLPHLTILHHRLALKVTGVSVAEHIISLRYWMFSRIYWSRPNRTLVAMTRFLIWKLSEDDGFLTRYRQRLLNQDSHQVMDYLVEETQRTNRPELVDLAALLAMAPQELYWVAFEASRKEAPEYGDVLERLSRWSLQDLDTLREKLSIHLEDKLAAVGETKGKVIVLVDLPNEPGGGNKLGADMLGVLEDGRSASLTDLSGIIHGVNDGFEGYLRRFRVLVHPMLAPREAHASRDLRDTIAAFIRSNV